MTNHLTHTINSNQSVVYQIRVKGQLGSQWTEWFGGMTIAPQANGDTVLTGAVIDQAALFGLLKKVRDLGMPLVSVNRASPPAPDAPDITSETNHFRIKKETIK